MFGRSCGSLGAGGSAGSWPRPLGADTGTAMTLHFALLCFESSFEIIVFQLTLPAVLLQSYLSSSSSSSTCCCCCNANSLLLTSPHFNVACRVISSQFCCCSYRLYPAKMFEYKLGILKPSEMFATHKTKCLSVNI